jgi:hypothetical protein
MTPRVFHEGATGGRRPRIKNFVSINISENFSDTKLDLEFGAPLDVFLKRRKIGKVLGNGSEESRDVLRNVTVRHVRIGVDLKDLDLGLELLKCELTRLGIPRDTIVLYNQNGLAVSEQVYAGDTP